MTTTTTRNEPEYLTHEDIARKLNIAVKTVRKWSYQRRIPGAVRLGTRCVRFRAVDVERALNSGKFLLNNGKE